MITKDLIKQNPDDYNKYFDWLERLRQSGITNMYGAGPYLEAHFNINEDEATAILVYWMEHYSELLKKRNWKR